MKSKLFVFAVAFAVHLKINAAEAPPTQEGQTTLLNPPFINQLAEEMRTNHPALKAAAARVDAAMANAASIRTWEDPMVTLGAMAARPDMRAEEGDVIYELEQKLPLFKKPKAARQLAQAETSTSEAQLDYQFQMLRLDLARALFKLGLADLSLQISREDLSWLETLTRSTQERYAAGQASQVDLLRLQNERSKRSDQLLTEERLRVQQAMDINRLLGRNLHETWARTELQPTADPIPYSDRLVSFATKYEPKIRLMERQISEARASVEVAERSRFPDVAVGAEARNYSGTGSFREGTLFFAFNIPLGNRSKYRNDLKREQLRLKAAELDRVDYELEVRREVHQLTLAIDAARREALLYQNEIIPRTEQALASAQGSWISGQGRLFDVLEARRMLLEARLMLARAISEQYQLMSELVLCCGLGDLEALQMISKQADKSAPDNNP